jgi:hypothetical protein
MQRLIPPWEYRHLRAWGGRALCRCIALVIGGALMLSHGSYGWIALLVAAALSFSFGYWEITVVRPHRPEPEPALLASTWAGGRRTGGLPAECMLQPGASCQHRLSSTAEACRQHDGASLVSRRTDR